MTPKAQSINIKKIKHSCSSNAIARKMKSNITDCEIVSANDVSGQEILPRLYKEVSKFKRRKI
jgi:hypothetical protein